MQCYHIESSLDRFVDFDVIGDGDGVDVDVDGDDGDVG